MYVRAQYVSGCTYERAQYIQVYVQQKSGWKLALPIIIGTVRLYVRAQYIQVYVQVYVHQNSRWKLALPTIVSVAQSVCTRHVHTGVCTLEKPLNTCATFNDCCRQGVCTRPVHTGVCTAE